MATKPVSKRDPGQLPQFEKIRVEHSYPDPKDEVEVAPGVGRIAFQNEDNTEYRIRFWSKGGEKNAIDIVLRALETITVAIKQDDEFFYYVVSKDGDKLMEGPGGPIKN